MTDQQARLIIGSLLHDIGKLVYRSGDGQNHSISGYQFLKNEAGITDTEILNCVRYHHGSWLRGADLPEDSLAYITYFADNVAAAVDRREGDSQEAGFDRSVPLSSVFNILNGNQGSMHYSRSSLDFSKGINYPTDREIRLDDSYYQELVRQIRENLKRIEYTEAYINSLLSILEAYTTYVPSSTSRKELADISFYDHVKMTAALAQCIEQVFLEKGENSYRKDLFQDAVKSYEKEWFLLFSLDVSGIQKFIYSVGSKGALKGLRSRSFYLELMMEHIVDELLTRESLSRANLIYVGGGHCYIILPNTICARDTAEAWMKEVNQWLLEMFQTDLYVAWAFAPCSALNLQNVPKGSYPGLFRKLSADLSVQKAHRYSAEHILYLNRRNESGDRECRICRRLKPLNEEDKCALCEAFESASGDILYQDYFVIMRGQGSGRLPLPGDCSFGAFQEKALVRFMNDPQYVRSYTKNNLYTGLNVTAKFLVGSYSSRMSFQEFSNASKGIDRIAVLRADVDNLGTAFVSGFSERFSSLSRTATLSRQLSLFFKGYINYILEHGTSHYLSSAPVRTVTIVYSGGDDLFLVGAWNEVIDVFLDIRKELYQFTEGMLTISGGIGLYPAGYPINLMAGDTEKLENIAKDIPGKNAVCVFDDSGAYSWDDFENCVLKEKFTLLEKFFNETEERGKAFLYHLLELLRNSGEKIQFARYIYLLSRMEPSGEADMNERNRYRDFSEKMVRWYQDPKDRKELITAIYLYVYYTRENEGGHEA